jgi:hypothetical protein
LARRITHPSVGVVRFLRHLLVHIPDTLLVNWAARDGTPIHHGQTANDLLATGAIGGPALRRLEQLPGDGPDVSPLD